MQDTEGQNISCIVLMVMIVYNQLTGLIPFAVTYSSSLSVDGDAFSL